MNHSVVEDVYKHSMADTGDEGAEAYSLEIMDTAGYTATVCIVEPKDY